MSSVWKIFARQPSHWEDSEDFADVSYRHGVIAVGWNDVGDLDQIDTRADLKDRLLRAYSKDLRGKQKRLGQWAGSLWTLKKLVEVGNIVLCPDRSARLVYVGKVQSGYFYRDTPLEGNCSFAHRRKVRWFRVLHHDQVLSTWKTGFFGGQQTVSEVNTGLAKLRKILGKAKPLKAKKPQTVTGVTWHPDKEWGRAAELRAMSWLRGNRRKPDDVADRCYGWDIECGEDKFEVKGRKSPATKIRLTENEWKAANRVGKRYSLLIFTAADLEKLKVAQPVRIPDPAKTAEWSKKPIFEYFLNEV
jgi:hypothetical protein